jgi:hypothetical protein
MLDTILKKVEQTYEQCLYHEKYIQTNDALSLSSFSLNDQKQPIDGNIPVLVGWEKLHKEILYILDEGYILIQQIHFENDQQIKVHALDPFELLKGNTFDQLLNQQEKLKISVLHKEIRYNLRKIHEIISEIFEEKLKILEIVNKIHHFYTNRITEIASRRGISKPSEKLDLILALNIEQLTKHRLYSVTEVTANIFVSFFLTF